MPPVDKGTYARELTDDPGLDRLQDEVKRLRTIMVACPFLQGSKVGPLSLTTSVLQVAHGLGRTPQGFIVIDASPDGAVGRSATQPAAEFRSQFINIEASVVMTATLWFY